MTDRRRLSKRWGRVCVVVLAAVLLPVGCDEYNRADISDDGKFIAFSFGDKGFVTDKSSEMYVFDVDQPGLKRLTVNTTCDAWADLSKDGVLFLGDADHGVGAPSVYSDDEARRLIQLPANGPLWISKDKVFFSGVTPKEHDPKTQDELVIGFFIWQVGWGDLERIVEIACNQERTLFSTLPAFYRDEQMYYAVARQEEGKGGTGMVKIDVLTIDLATKQKRVVTTFEFAGSLKKEKEKDTDWPVGYVDLAISPDDKKLICCFLPGKGISEKGFDSSLSSQVYIVDVSSGEKVLFSKDFNMFYPQWALIPASATQPATQAASTGAVAAQPAAPKYRFLYLSGSLIGEGRTVWITDLAGDRRKLADLPDKVMEGYSGWTWLSEEHIRIFHVGGSGLRVVDVSADGTETHTRSLSMDQLRGMKRIADLEGLITYLEKQSQQVRENVEAVADKDISKRGKDIREEYEKQIKKLRKQLEELNEELFDSYRPVGW